MKNIVCRTLRFRPKAQRNPDSAVCAGNTTEPSSPARTEVPTMNAVAAPSEREDGGLIFVGLALLTIFVLFILGRTLSGRWFGAFATVSNFAAWLAAVAVTAGWAGTRSTSLARGAQRLTIIGIVLTTLMMIVRRDLVEVGLSSGTAAYINLVISAFPLGGAVVSFISMAIETKVLSDHPIRFLGFAGAIAAAFRIFFHGYIPTGVFLVTGGAVALAFGIVAKRAARSPVSGPDIQSWRKAIAGAKQLKNALFLLLPANLISHMLSRNLESRDALMWPIIGIEVASLVVGAGLLVWAATGAGQFRQVPSPTQARGAATATAKYIVVAAATAMVLLAVRGLSMTEFGQGMSFVYGTVDWAPILEAKQFVFCASAVLCMIAAVYSVGTAMDAPRVRAAARKGFIFFGLGGLLVLPSRDAIVSAATTGVHAIYGANIIAGLAGLMAIITGLIYLSRALTEADLHLAGYPPAVNPVAL